MSTAPKPILVTGATGRQGGSVVAALLASPTAYLILAVTRDPTSHKATALASLSPASIRLVRGDLDDIPSLWAAACGAAAQQPIWGVYSVQVSLGAGVTCASETAQGVGLVDAAAASGTVRVFVYSSVDRGGDAASWADPTPIPHFRSKHAVERHLAAAASSGEKMAWTILRPTAFMDNLTPGLGTAVFLAALHNHLPPARRLQWVASADVGHWAALAFDEPEAWSGRAVGLAGDALTLAELDAAFRAATGKPAPVAYRVLGSLLTALAGELRAMIAWFAERGYGADVEARRRENPGLMTLETYLRRNAEWQAASGR